MSGYPLVSVVIPTWNRRQLVQEAIASVVAQTHENWELIVVDDGSTDGTVEELRKLEDARIRLIAAPHSGSTAVSRNLGIDAAKGEWIAFLDSDDLWLPDKLEVQLRAVAESGAAWCYGNYTLMDASGADIPLKVGQFRPVSGRIIEALLSGQTAVHVNCLLVRRDLLDDLQGFDENLRNREDLDFDFRLAVAADAIAVPQSLARIRDHSGRKTAAIDFAHEQSARVYEKFLDRRPERNLARLARAMLASHLASAGPARIARGEFRTGWMLLVRALALRDRPGHWLRAAARGARAMFGR